MVTFDVLILFDSDFTSTQDAQKFARHARRQKLTTEDVNNALRMRNAEVSEFPCMQSILGCKYETQEL